ncbi:MAG: EamA family transporter [Actinomycetales bacterium]
MISILFGLATATFFSVSSLAASRAVRTISSPATVAWAMTFGGLLLLPWIVISGPAPQVNVVDLVWWCAAGAGNIIGLLLAYVAFRHGKVGLITAIVSTEGAIAAVIAVAFGESLLPIAGLILLVIMVGIVLAALAPDPAPIALERPAVAVGLGVLASAAFGVSLFAFGHLSDAMPLPWLLMSTRVIGVVVIALPMLVWYLARSSRFERSDATARFRKALPYVLTISVSEVVGFVCFTLGTREAIAVTSVLASMYAPLTAVAAYLLFKERLGRWQIVGVAVVITGVIGLSLAGG